MNDKLVFIFSCITIFLVLFIKKHQDRENNKPVTNWPWKDEWHPETNPGFNPTVPQQQQQLVATNFEEAKKLASQYNKSIFMVFHADWCSWCQRLENNSLKDKEVIELMKNYILFKVNTDKDSSTTSLFKVKSLPTMIISNGSTVRQLNGYQEKENLILFLKGN